MNGTMPRVPEVGQIWSEDSGKMIITQVSEDIVRLEDVEPNSRRYTVIPRSMWPPSRFRYEGKA